jgi:hypothetical protein
MSQRAAAAGVQQPQQQRQPVPVRRACHLVRVDFAVLAREARRTDAAVASRPGLLADGGGVPARRGRALIWVPTTGHHTDRRGHRQWLMS